MIAIHDKSNPKPFFTRIPTPTSFKTTVDEKKYWEKQKKYWIDGYNSDINGMLYFYAQEVKLKDRIKGKIFYPTVRDADILIFNELKRSLDERTSPFVVKGRGVGLSSIGMNLPLYFFRVYPNSKCIATSKDKQTLAQLYNDKTMVAYEEMNESIRPDLIGKNQTSNQSYLKVGMNYVDDDKKTKYGISEFLCRETQESEKSTTNFSGSGAIYGFADEAPLMPRFFNFFSSAIECFTDHSKNRLEGLLLSGGTVEDSIPVESIQRLSDIWNVAKIMNINPIFIPATYGKHMTNGHSDHKKAEEEILKKRDDLDKLEDKSQLNAYIKNNPLTIEDIFSFKGSGMFDDYALQVISKQRKDAVSKSIPFYHIYKHNNTYEADPTDKGFTKILEHPKPNVEYIVGYDGIMTSELTSSAKNNSKLSVTVMKGIDPQSELQFCPVAAYLERPKTIEFGNENTVRILKYYNKYGKAKIIGEVNAAGEHLIQMVINSGMRNCILYRRDLNKTGWVDTKQPWYYRNDKILNWQIEAANIYFKKYGHMVWFDDILKDAQKLKSENKDSLDSFMACLYGFGTGDLFGKAPKKIPITLPSERLTWQDVNGQLRQVWVKE
jgi:hypothetical protein